MVHQRTPKRTLEVTPPPSSTQTTNLQRISRPMSISPPVRSSLKENNTQALSVSPRPSSSSTTPTLSVAGRTKPPSVSASGISRIARSTVPVTTPTSSRETNRNDPVISVSERPRSNEISIGVTARTRPEGVSVTGGLNRVSNKPVGISFPSKRMNGGQPENSELSNRVRITRGIGLTQAVTVSDL